MENDKQGKHKKVNKIKEHFSTKTSEQIFSLCLLIGIVTLMLFCCIVRLFGCLWFTADLSKIQEPSREWQEIIMGLLLAFELTFVYKILCRKKWLVCILIAACETLSNILIGYLVQNINDGQAITNVFHLLCIFLIPIPFVKHWMSLIDSATVYILSLLYGLAFMVGRIGNFDNYAYNFIANVVGIIDYKLFIIALYLTINYFGGIRLWKKQKRLILIKTLPTKE